MPHRNSLPPTKTTSERRCWRDYAKARDEVEEGGAALWKEKRWGWKWLFTNTVNMKRNIRAIMSFRVFTPIFLIKVPLLPEWMDERASDGCGENRRHTWVDGGGSNTNEQHPLIYHICSFFSCHASATPFLHFLTQEGVYVLRMCLCERWETAPGRIILLLLSYTCPGSWWRWLWRDMTCG